MFSWGQDSQRGFVLKGDSDSCRSSCRSSSGDGVHHLNIGCPVADLSAGLSVLAFVKNNGNAFILRVNESRDGRRVRGKQKFVKFKEPIEAVSCQDDVVTFLSERGSVLCVDTTRTPYTPRMLEVFANIPVAQVSCGSQHSVALTRDGQVYTWGLDSRGQLGLGRRNCGAGSPQHLQSLSSVPVVRIAAGGERSFALSVSGGVLGWGRNDCGQLGLGDTKDRYTPTCLHSLNLKKSCDVSCGKDHTAVLTKHGVVFTFGSGRHGQLGHNSFRDELRPRLVAELWGAKVAKVACGRNHTLVLTDANKVYSFGCGDDGQLGHGEESHPSVPLPVSLPQDTDSQRVQNIFAGENCSFATCSSDEGPQGSSTKVAQYGLEGVVDKWVSECDSKSWKKIQQEIHRSFSTASCLNKSFLEQRDKHFQTSSKYHGLNFKQARQFFKKLVKKSAVWEEVEAAVLRLLPLLDRNPVSMEGLRVFLLLNELLHVLQKHTAQQNTRLTEALAAAVTGLSVQSLQVLGNWWSSLSPSTMRRFIVMWKQALSLIFTYDPVPRSSGVRNLLQVLQYMYNVNSRASAPRRLPESLFYLPLSENFLEDDLKTWSLRSQNESWRAEPLVLCSFPMVMDLQAKMLVFDMNARLTMNKFQLSALEQVFRNIFLGLGIYSLVSEFLELDVRRASVLKDAFEQLADTDHQDYRRQLVVRFDGNVLPSLVYQKDFFHEVFHEMVSFESGMFMFNDSETLAWFSSRHQAADRDQRWYLFGVLCGLALYNQAIVYLPFPLVLFKKLLGFKPSLEDMIEFSPKVGKSLRYILDDYPDDDLVDLDMVFTISWEATDVHLDTKNPNKQVTNQNKEEFVAAYVNYAFNTSVETVFEDFSRGFFHVCERDLVRLFRPEELQEILVGKDFQDWEKLKQNTSYEGEYHADHDNIRMFWEVFDELTEDQKKAFLWFVTGFERVPVLGLDKIEISIRVKYVPDLSSPDQYYPEAYTCYSFLELPLYSNKEILRSQLTEALSNNNQICKRSE
ncbi:probable E3 ubiquitin-protein ligase HERC3 [Austrofundulus limnaeus]|uniref:Probable E3 ubiquitin-protein ligase HERC3 n=1 Tax=Austrofundulus limnaeus TaxID=52670 RepID=A0A2I4BIT4_AUSLI|nr:PREDICTED: probable E3 ubiquitin-protein ligase HERC3 [Austrofundulus limnaeus]